MPSPVFYRQFERHDHANGLKAHTTSYCPGCGHGVVQKFLAEAIDDLGVQDRTVLVSPVGCSYYWFDVGNTQAAHGRAPAVALGHKTANPDAVVVCYQGDGDLASIGLAEIISTAQLGVPITVIFANNAIYGMTGGQMAPTTLVGQPTATSPHGRDPFMGQPLKVAELIAALDGPVFVERVALYDNKHRTHAKRAIEKALRLQVDGVGFAFIEVLSECPIHLHLEPEQAEQWVHDTMEPVFPLGVKKDITADARHPGIPTTTFDVEHTLATLGATTDHPDRFATGFPMHLDPDDVSVKLAGAGGDGAQTAAMLITRAAINEGFDSTHIPSYGPESRGGTSYADVHVARTEVLAPAAPDPHVLVAFNAPSLARFGPMVRAGGLVLYDSSTVGAVPEGLADGVRVVGVPFTEALQQLTQLFPAETFLALIRSALHGKRADLTVNEDAFARGVEIAAAA
jgi:2-oxoisovalerate ferredoxin oxidoreductase beta subunit